MKYIIECAMYDNNSEAGRRTLEPSEEFERERGWRELTVHDSSAMSVTDRIRAIKVGILTAHEPTMLVVCMEETRRQLVPCIGHHSLDDAMGDRTALAAQLLPIVEESVVQWRHALGSVGGHEKNVFDRLRAAIMERLTYGIDVLVNAGFIQHQRQRISIKPLHRLSQCVVDELVQHGGVDAANVCALPLSWSEHFGQQSLDSSADSDHVVASSVGRSVGRLDEWLLAWQHECVIRSGVES